MKKSLLLAVLLAMFVSCSKSLDDKANALIEDDIKKELYYPETYDPAETLIDSAFTPYDDPVFFEKTLQLYKLGVDIEGYERKMKDAKSSMSLWDGPFKSAYGSNNYQEAKEEYDENAKNKKSAEKKARKLADELKKMIDEEPQFIGFKAWHSYRAKNVLGLIVFGEMVYLFDKDMNKIIVSYDADDKEYKAVQMVYEQLFGEDIQIEEDNFDGTVGE